MRINAGQGQRLGERSGRLGCLQGRRGLGGRVSACVAAETEPGNTA